MPYDNRYNRMVGAQVDKADQEHINNLKKDHLYVETIPQTTASASKYIDTADYYAKKPMSGYAAGTWKDTGISQQLGVKADKNAIKGGIGMDTIGQVLDHVPVAFKQTPGVVPALIQQKLGLGKKKASKTKKESKKESKSACKRNSYPNKYF